MEPFTTMPGGNPVIEVPGYRPIFPNTTLGPVLVIVSAPRMVKFSQEPVYVDCAETLHDNMIIVSPAMEYPIIMSGSFDRILRGFLLLISELGSGTALCPCAWKG